ncbi:MAG: hypothetical protein AB7V50_04590, partial [Vampirovibrionia bacterium]
MTTNNNCSCNSSNNEYFKDNKLDILKFINEKRMVDVFIKIVKVETTSIPDSKSFPSSEGQKILAQILVEELKNIGVEDVMVDEHHVVTATLPDNMGNIINKPTIGLLAHMDTSDSVPGDNVNPLIHKNYQGGDINLKDNTTILAKQLHPFIGQDIITSDGTTLLGADNKAGIAEILEALMVYKENHELIHPK